MAFAAHAQLPTPEMPPMAPELEARLKKLETELRCLVCQNQTLAESPAGLAGDLRREIRLLADQNKSNEEIKEHLRVRYGDFVLYRPQLDSKNYLLWFGPFALLFGGAIMLWVMNRRRAKSVQQTPLPVDAEILARGNSLLKDD
jgi:cytochrome c-type biogenesis protein CcmH